MDRPGIPKAAFARLVRQIASTIKKDVLFEPLALIALQTDAEEYMAHRFVRAGLLADRFCTKTVTEKHFSDLVIPSPPLSGMVVESVVSTPPEACEDGQGAAVFCSNQ